jgi:hypothetical protein
MKCKALLLVVVLSAAIASAQPGQYAGGFKKTVGKPFAGARPDRLFQQYQYTGGFLLDDSRQEFEVWITLYRKGNTQLAVMSTLDTVNQSNKVLDILEVKLADRHTNLQSGSCSIGSVYSIEIIAAERKGKILNAWRAVRDKLRFQKMPKASLTSINCTVQGAD